MSSLRDSMATMRGAPGGLPASSGMKGDKVRGILARLQRLEESQYSMIEGIKRSHAEEMAVLRNKLDSANALRRQAAEQAALDIVPQPVLMEVNMTEIEAAVQAASCAEQESAQALREARMVAENARRASSGIPESAVAASREGHIGYGPDGEYLVKRVSVNLDDVERAINNSPMVEVCRAFGRPDTKYGNEVYCAVVPKKNVRVSEPMMMTYAQKYLPTAMVPKRFFFLQDLPSGITRRALADTQEIGDPKKKDVLAIENKLPRAVEN